MSNASTLPTLEASPRPPRLLDQIRQAACALFARPEPGERYAQWVRRFIVFHGMRHPRELGLGELGRFLEHIAQSEKDPLRSIEQAREALEFLYVNVLHVNLGELPFPEPPRLLDRLRRALRLRHYSPRTETCYVEWVARFIRFHGRRQLHERDLAAGLARVALPDALARKYPQAAQELGWQFLFASRQRCWVFSFLLAPGLTGYYGSTKLGEGVPHQQATTARERGPPCRKLFSMVGRTS